ncbi:MAG: DMT family transporter [Acidimicrobiales bacterium]
MSTPADSAAQRGTTTPGERSRRTGGTALGAAVAGVVLFSTGPVIVADADLEGLAFAFWRLWTATVVMNLILLARRRRLDRAVLVATAPAGLALGVNMALFFSAVQQTSVANATLISVLSPIPLLIAGRFVFGESATGRDVAWILLAIAGAALVLRSSNTEGTGDLGGDLLALGSMVALAVYFAAGKRARHTVDTLGFMAGLFAWGAIIITPIAVLSGQALIPDGTGGETWLRVALVVALPGTGHVLTNFAHNGVPLSVVGILQLANPVGAALLAFWLLDQQVAALQVVGMVIVIGALGVYTYQRSERGA